MLPDAETALQNHLGSRYIASDWQLALKAVMDAEGDVEQAAEAVAKLAVLARRRSGLVLKLPRVLNKPSQLEALEQDLLDSVTHLVNRNRIFGTPPSINKLVDPAEEREDPDFEAETFEDDAAIVAEVHWWETIQNGDLIEVILDSEDGENDPESEPAMTVSELIALTAKLEGGYISRIGTGSSPDFLHHLRKFRAELRRDELKNAKQSTFNIAWPNCSALDTAHGHS